MREFGLRLHSPGRKGDIEGYIKACTTFSEFLNRRGGCESLNMPDPDHDFDTLSEWLNKTTGCDAQIVRKACDEHEDDMFPW